MSSNSSTILDENILESVDSDAETVILCEQYSFSTYSTNSTQSQESNEQFLEESFEQQELDIDFTPPDLQILSEEHQFQQLSSAIETLSILQQEITSFQALITQRTTIQSEIENIKSPKYEENIQLQNNNQIQQEINEIKEEEPTLQLLSSIEIEEDLKNQEDEKDEKQTMENKYFNKIIPVSPTQMQQTSLF